MENRNTGKMLGKAAAAFSPRHAMASVSRARCAIGLRGQAATETLVLVGFALAFLFPLALLFLSSSNTELGKSSVQQAKISARSITDAAGEVFLQGKGAKSLVLVNFPPSVVNGSVENNLVVLTLDLEGRGTDVVSSTFANLSGSLSGRRLGGIQRILLENTGDFVNVSYADASQR